MARPWSTIHALVDGLRPLLGPLLAPRVVMTPPRSEAVMAVAEEIRNTIAICLDSLPSAPLQPEHKRPSSGAGARVILRGTDWIRRLMEGALGYIEPLLWPYFDDDPLSPGEVGEIAASVRATLIGIVDAIERLDGPEHPT